MTSLNTIPLTKLAQAEVAALARIHLWTTSKTHEMMLQLGKAAQVELLRGAPQGSMDGADGYQVQQSLLRLWSETHEQWTKMFLKARLQAARLPFALLAETHQRLMKPLALAEAVVDGVFDPQIQIVLDAAGQKMFDDGLNLSGRIWKLDREARAGIQQVIMNGVTNQLSAMDMARQLEVFLGAGADCPRWTSTRLYGMTKKEIASGDLRGLMSGEACDGSGISYNALRLARTEIQAVHAMATDAQLAMSPWVEKEQIHLSAGHPEEDICDETIRSGEEGAGIYPVGTVALPLHPNCLCYKTGVTMSEKDFIQQMKGWLNGTSGWAEMDAYAEGIGGVDRDLGSATLALGVWLFGNKDELAKVMR
jgi:hypothetical protein